MKMVKISAKILKRIEQLQYDEPLLKRHFVFDSVKYDESDGYIYT